MEAVIEFQSFKNNQNRFIVKELAIIGRSYKTQILFKPPYSYDYLNSKMQRTARWLTRHYHHLKWSDGDLPYDEELIRDLCKPFDVIYTKGFEKANFLRELHNNVKEIDNPLHFDENIKVDCIVKQHSNCALKSAVFYASILFK